MNDRADIYTYHRVSDRKTKRKMLPSFPTGALRGYLARTLSWETGLLTVISFLAGRAMLAGGLTPFPAAFLAAVMTVVPDKGLWVLLAAVLGQITVSSGYSLGATLLSLVFLFLILGLTRGQFRHRWYGVPLLVLGLITTVKAGVYAFYAPELYNYIIALFEAVLAGCLSFLFIRVLPAFRKSLNPGGLRNEEIVGGAVLIVAFLTGLSELQVAGVEVKNIVGRALVILAAYTGGSGFGAAMGTLVGMIPSITTVIAPGMVALYSFSGLLAGMFKGFGRIGICIGFILGNVLLSIYLNDYAKLITAFIETAAAVGLFLVIPQKRLFAARTVIKNSLSGSRARPGDEKKVQEAVSAKIRDYSRIFQELSRTFSEIACDVKIYEENNLQNLFNGIAAKVCKGCSLYRICWDKEFYKTYRNVMDMISYIEVNGRITEEHILPDISKRCTRLREMAITVNCLFETYKQSRVWQRKLAEGRDIIAAQLNGLAAIMRNLANEVKIDLRMQEDIEAILRSELAKAGYNILSISVVGEGNDHLEITVSCPSCGGKMECLKGINPLVSRILSQPLTVLNSNYCTKKTGEPVCEFKMVPARAFQVELGFASAAKDRSSISGDSYSTLDMKDGRFAVILSDGMGVGPKAAMESKATITLLEKLLETGFEQNLAVKTVNSILVLGSPDETFATVDMAVINLMDGVAGFIKIGSAPSFVKRGGQVGMIRANSLPIGILNNIEVDTIEQPLGHDDVLVMVSDGLLSAAADESESETWIVDALQNIYTTDPQNIADMLLKKALNNTAGIINDDMTVIVVRLVSAHKTV